MKAQEGKGSAVRTTRPGGRGGGQGRGPIGNGGQGRPCEGVPWSGVSQEVAGGRRNQTDRRVREQQAKRPWGGSERLRPGWLERSVGSRKWKGIWLRRRGVGDRRWHSKVCSALWMLLRMQGKSWMVGGGGIMLCDWREKQCFHNKHTKPR